MHRPLRLPQRSIRSRLAAALTRSRITLYSIALPLLLALTLSGSLVSTQRMVLVIIGFSAIIFVHELGHFVVARLCSVRCDVFSLGIGPRMLGWKKGVGFSFGNEPDEKTKDKHSPFEGALTTGDIEQSDPDAEPPAPRSAEAAARNPNLGTTDYRLSWLPLGGYVRMLGQDDMDPTKVSADPNAFNNRPIWQRMCIVAAGVTMNLITAFIIFAYVFNYGIDFPPAFVGGVAYDSPAWNATYTLDGKTMKGLRPGDEITRINGKAANQGFLEFTDVMISAALSSGTDAIDYTIKRDGKEFDVAIIPARSPDNGLLALGIDGPKSMRLPEIDADEKEAAKEILPNVALFNSHDVITSINGVNLNALDEPLRYAAITAALQKANGKPVTLGIHPETGSDHEISLTPELRERDGVKEEATLLGFSPPIRISQVGKDSPAEKAGIKTGDLIARVGNQEWPTEKQFQTIVKGNPLEELSLDVLRDGKLQTLTAKPALNGGEGLLGVGLTPGYDNALVPVPDPASAAAKAGIIAGSTLTAINDTPIASWKDVYIFIRDNEPGTVKLHLRAPGSATIQTVDFPFTQADKDEAEKLTFILGIQTEAYTKPQKADTLWGAVNMGLDHTKNFILQTYATLYGLFNRTVPPDQLHGIIGIAKVGHDIQARGFIWLLYVLGMVSVNLAVANFLPLPIVDGGLFLLLIVEKIRGKPLPLDVQKYIQIVGLCLLGAMFLFVTKNDLSMFFTK